MAEAELAERGPHADATINQLTGEHNLLVHPYSQQERAAMAAADGASDGSGEEMEEGEEEESIYISDPLRTAAAYPGGWVGEEQRSEQESEDQRVQPTSETGYRYV